MGAVVTAAGGRPQRDPCSRPRDGGDRLELRCIRCGAVGLEDTGTAWECRQCGAAFPIVSRIPRFVAKELYTESFGFQWNRFARTQLDSANGTTRSREDLILKTGWSLEALRGKRILDAGCGMGRFAEICADAGAEVHGVDLSLAAEAAFGNLGHRANVRVYQADLMNLPFPEESFELIYSIGVLHHTPDTRAAFHRLPSLLKLGGEIAIWVYSTELRSLLGGEILRRLTPRLPKGWLLRLCRLADPLFHLYHALHAVHPKLASVSHVCLPVSLDPDPEWRRLGTFDWYAPTYQWKHTSDEVEGWFREAGLTDLWRGPFPVSVRGRRPRPGGTGTRERP